MNRREVLKLAYAAPIALPMAAKVMASTQLYARGGFSGEAFIGRPHETILPARVGTIKLDAGQVDKILSARIAELRSISIPSQRFFTPAEMCRAENAPNYGDPGVEAQMLEHDLFEPKEFFPAAAHRSAG